MKKSKKIKKSSSPSFTNVVGVLCALIIGVYCLKYLVIERPMGIPANLEDRKAQMDLTIKSETVKVIAKLNDYSKKNQKKEATDFLRNYRYGKKQEGYFWADSPQGTNIVFYGNKDVEGKNRMEAHEKGVFYMKEIIAAGTQMNGGFTEYYFPKIKGGEAVAKRAYSILFKPFNWVIGTSYFLDDLK